MLWDHKKTLVGTQRGIVWPNLLGGVMTQISTQSSTCLVSLSFFLSPFLPRHNDKPLRDPPLWQAVCIVHLQGELFSHCVHAVRPVVLSRTLTVPHVLFMLSLVCLCHVLSKESDGGKHRPVPDNRHLQVV